MPTPASASLASEHRPPLPDGRQPKFLAPSPGAGTRFPFHGQIEIGRDDGKHEAEPGLLLFIGNSGRGLPMAAISIGSSKPGNRLDSPLPK